MSGEAEERWKALAGDLERALQDAQGKGDDAIRDLIRLEDKYTRLREENERLREALELAKEALEDLGACDVPECTDCNQALTKVRAALGEQS